MSTPPLGSPIMNPLNLVVAGLVPEDLLNILITPPGDAAVCKKRKKCITGAETLREDAKKNN